MVSTYAPIPLSAASSNSTSTNVFGSQSSLNNADFTKILLAQMANPDLSSLFGGENNQETSSLFGGSNSSFGLQNLLGTNSQAGANPLASFVSPQMELSIFSNLIGKNIEALDQLTGSLIKDKVKSVIIQDGKTYLEVGDTLVSPSSIIKVS